MISVYVCMYVCMYVCNSCRRNLTHSYIHWDLDDLFQNMRLNTLSRTSPYIYTHAHICICVSVCITPVDVTSLIRVCIEIYRLYSRAWDPTRTSTHIRVHTYAHIHTQTHMCVCIIVVSFLTKFLSIILIVTIFPYPPHTLIRHASHTYTP